MISALWSFVLCTGAVVIVIFRDMLYNHKMWDMQDKINQAHQKTIDRLEKKLSQKD